MPFNNFRAPPKSQPPIIDGPVDDSHQNFSSLNQKRDQTRVQHNSISFSGIGKKIAKGIQSVFKRNEHPEAMNSTNNHSRLSKIGTKAKKILNSITPRFLTSSSQTNNLSQTNKPSHALDKRDEFQSALSRIGQAHADQGLLISEDVFISNLRLELLNPAIYKLSASMDPLEKEKIIEDVKTEYWLHPIDDNSIDLKLALSCENPLTVQQARELTTITRDHINTVLVNGRCHITDRPGINFSLLRNEFSKKATPELQHKLSDMDNREVFFTIKHKIQQSLEGNRVQDMIFELPILSARAHFTEFTIPQCKQLERLLLEVGDQVASEGFRTRTGFSLALEPKIASAITKVGLTSPYLKVLELVESIAEKKHIDINTIESIDGSLFTLDYKNASPIDQHSLELLTTEARTIQNRISTQGVGSFVGAPRFLNQALNNLFNSASNESRQSAFKKLNAFQQTHFIRTLTNSMRPPDTARINTVANPDPDRFFSENDLINNSEFVLRSLTANALEISLENINENINSQGLMDLVSTRLTAYNPNLQTLQRVTQSSRDALEAYCQNTLQNLRGSPLYLTTTHGEEAKAIIQFLKITPKGTFKIQYRGENGIDAGGLTREALTAAFEQRTAVGAITSIFSGVKGNYYLDLDKLPTIGEQFSTNAIFTALFAQSNKTIMKEFDQTAYEFGLLLGQILNTKMAVENPFPFEFIEELSGACQSLHLNKLNDQLDLSSRESLTQAAQSLGKEQLIKRLKKTNSYYESPEIGKNLSELTHKDLQERLLDQAPLLAMAKGLISTQQHPRQVVIPKELQIALFGPDQFKAHFLERVQLSNPDETLPTAQIHTAQNSADITFEAAKIFAESTLKDFDESEIRALCRGITGARSLPPGQQPIKIEFGQTNFNRLAHESMEGAFRANSNATVDLAEYQVFASGHTCSNTIELNIGLLKPMIEAGEAGKTQFKQALLASCDQSFNAG